MNVSPRKICLDHRLDVIFRVFVLTTNNKKAWEEFRSVPANHKVKRKKLFELEKSIETKGQKCAVPVVSCGEKFYLINGACRTSIVLHLNLPMIKVDVQKLTPKLKKFNPNYRTGGNPFTRSWTKESDYFAISDNLMEQFLSWKKQWEAEYYV